jgi:hypothetical protein
VSSAGSSFLIRMRGGRIGYESSLTSGEDEYEQSKYARGTEVRSLRKRNVEEPRSTQDGKMVFMIVQLPCSWISTSYDDRCFKDTFLRMLLFLDALLADGFI